MIATKRKVVARVATNPGRVLLATVMMGFFGLSSVLFADDDYLKSLEMEAETLDVPTAEPRSHAAPSSVGPAQSNWLANSQSLMTELPPSLSRADFELALQGAFYGTFVFYRKLSSEQQDAVYAAYQERATVSNVRSKIIRLYKQH